MKKRPITRSQLLAYMDDLHKAFRKYADSNHIHPDCADLANKAILLWNVLDEGLEDGYLIFSENKEWEGEEEK